MGFVLIVFSVALLAILVKSDIGQAIADAIRHGSGAGDGAAAPRELEQMRADIDELRAELDGLNAQLLEAHERLDFAERLMAKTHEPGQLPE